LWTALVDLDDVQRVDFDGCAAYGLTADELVGDNYAPTQALAVAGRAAGFSAMIVPSAALPGAYNLILFGVRLLHPYLWQPLAPEEIPTGHITDGGVRQPRWPPTSTGSAAPIAQCSSGKTLATTTFSMIRPQPAGDGRRAPARSS
jgi:RES domain